MAQYKISGLTAYPNSTFGVNDKFEVSYLSSGVHYSRYLTGTQIINTVIAQTITDGVTTSSPSQNAVFDALALKLTIPTTFKWTLDMNAVLTGDIYPNQACTIASVTNLVGSPTTTILKNGSAYTLGGAIASGDKITVTVSVASVIDLNFTI